MDVENRLNGIAQILTESNARMDRKQNKKTGFLPLHPLSFLKLATGVTNLVTDKKISFDLMCGNGGWALMTAAAGHPSYGIDINEVLIEEARANHRKAVASGFIDPGVPCEFVAGDIYSGASYEKYLAQSEIDNGSPRLDTGSFSHDPYSELGANISDAGIIYAFVWSAGLTFLGQFLDKEASQDALFVIPLYDASCEGISLVEASAISGPYQILKRREKRGQSPLLQSQ